MIISFLILIIIYCLHKYITAWIIWLQGNLTINPNSEFCNPDSLIQAHGIWHILTAVSTIFFFYHYRSERSV